MHIFAKLKRQKGYLTRKPIVLDATLSFFFGQLNIFSYSEILLLEPKPTFLLIFYIFETFTFYNTNMTSLNQEKVKEKKKNFESLVKFN